MTEDQLQAQCVKWFSENYPEHRGLLFAIPNGGLRDQRTANLLVATGVVAGVADMCLILDSGRCVWIETKLPAGMQSVRQEQWEAKVAAMGHTYIIYRTFEQFKTIICQLIGKPY